MSYRDDDDSCGRKCVGVRRKRHCGGYGDYHGHCGGGDCSTCYGPGVDHGDCEPDEPEPDDEGDVTEDED